MEFVPAYLGPLFHHIVPCIDFIFLEIIQQVEWSTRQAQYFGLFLDQLSHNRFTQFGLGAFVRFIHDNQVPIGSKHLVILVKIATHKFGTAQILHGCKIDVMKPVDFCSPFKTTKTFAVVLGTVCKILAVVKYLTEILKPSGIHHRAMSQNQGTLKLHILDNLQSRKGLSETHLCVPEHLVAFLKLFLGLVDGFLLFRAEYNWRILLGNFH